MTDALLDAVTQCTEYQTGDSPLLTEMTDWSFCAGMAGDTPPTSSTGRRCAASCRAGNGRGSQPILVPPPVKALTSMTPLQYQKQLRLTEARRLMLSDALSVERATYRVGYASPSQFSREYARMFGTPPRNDVASIRGMR